MFGDTVTVFNYHEASGMWYLSVVSGVDFGSAKASTRGAQSEFNNADEVIILLPCGTDGTVTTSDGVKSYIAPKEYAQCGTPAEYITFRPECDFVFAGEWPDLSPITEVDYESGLYSELNDAQDEIYMITSASFYGLLPHYEIWGK